MITEIGITAGEIWKALDENGSLELEFILQKVPMGRELGHMAVGWFCREGHIAIEQHDGKTLIELTNKKTG